MTLLKEISDTLREKLVEELKKEDQNADSEVGLDNAMRRIANRIEAGENELHDPFNPSDEALLALYKK